MPLPKVFKHSEETLKKMALSQTGRKHSIETRKKMSLWQVGKKHSEETKRRISESEKGKKISQEHIEKLRKFNTGKPRSEEIRKKISEAKKGEKSHLWRGGITPINQKIRKSFEYRIWRESVFKRDNYTCVWCGLKFIKGITGDVILNADHIKPFAYYPELRFAIDNGRTLCKPCHLTTNTYGRN